MPYRGRGRGQFTATSSRSGKSYTYAGRRVLLREKGFQLNWNGDILGAQLLTSIQRGLQNLSDQALTYMQSIVPVDTGTLRDSCYVNITSEGNRFRLEIGATASYAVYIELGTFNHAAQPFIRPTFDFIKSKLPEIIKAEVGRRGRI